MHDDTDKTNGADAKRGSGNAGVQQEVPLITFTLRDSHRKEDFRTQKSSEVERFLKEQALDQVRRNICGVFIWENPADRNEVWGYYSLSAMQIFREQMSNKHRSSLRRKTAPMALLGYMGRTDSLEKGKYGSWLVQDAARRAIKAREYLGIWGLMLEAENLELAEWYERPDIGFKRCATGTWINPERPLMYASLEGFPLTVQVS
jgi:hypothetical protein